jgi:Fe-Mn family superoxide dismutase
MIENTDLEGKDLDTIIKAAAADPAQKGLFNNAAQVWNHSFFWQCMKPGGGGKPDGKIAELIDKKWGSYEDFAAELKQAGISQFGSGWAWLALQGAELEITKTPNAENLSASGLRPLLVVDVWEHAYYLDYQNRRPDFLQTFLDHLINWDFVNANLK